MDIQNRKLYILYQEGTQHHSAPRPGWPAKLSGIFEAKSKRTSSRMLFHREGIIAEDLCFLGSDKRHYLIEATWSIHILPNLTGQNQSKISGPQTTRLIFQMS